MCGISGFVCPGNEMSKDDLLAFNNLQSHRGPDHQDVFYDGYCGMAHQRLRIIDISKCADQPMESHCKRYVIIYNGEVYNFKEILQQIKTVNPSFEPISKSDTEIILQAFVLWGADFVNKLNGMFAIAIYDKQSRDLYLFRDRIGVKPLYYFHSSNIFVYASELKAIAKTPEVRKQLTLSKTSINQYLHLGYIPAPNSIYNEVKKLPPGHSAILSKGVLKVNTWWKAEDKISDIKYSNEADAINKLRDIAESAVSQCLVSDVPFGTFLSGGIDSSLVTAIAQKHSKKPVNTFSIAFNDSKYNEAVFAKKVASYLQTNHHEFEVTQKQVLEWIPDLMNIYDEPFADSSALPTLLVSRLAREHVKMTLSGDGGDELFMGYGSYVWAKRLSNPLMPLMKLPAAFLLGMGNQRMKRASHLFKYKDKKNMPSHIFSQEQYFFSRKELGRLLRPEFRQEFELNEKLKEPPRALSNVEQQSLFDLRYYLPDDLLVKVDRASMHFSLETRVPLLDYRLVEFAINLDEKLKLKNNTLKYLLRKLLAEYLPAELFDRPKWGFAIPLKSWMKKELKHLCEHYLDEETVKKHGVFDYTYINKLKKEFYQNNNDYLYNRLWQVIVLQMWLEKA